MIEINNKYIVLMLLVIIIGVFIYNYDVYVIPKNEPLCKPVFVTKRELTPEIRAELNKTESEILKETFDNLTNIEYFESFGNLDNTQESSQYVIPPKSFSTFTIPSLTTEHKIKVMDSVIKILSYVPTNYSEVQIKQMVEYFAIIYENSSDLETFYKNISISTKIKEPPYNSKYSHLILYLIGKFDSDYLSCSNDQTSNVKYTMSDLLKEIINSNNTINNDNDNQMSSDYLSEQISVDNKNDFNPKQVLNMIEQSKGNTHKNIILPKSNQIKNISNKNIPNKTSNYLDEQYPLNSNVPNYIDSIKSQSQSSLSKLKKTSKTLKHNSSQSNETSQINSNNSNSNNSNSMPMESFGNIFDNYAMF